MDVGWFACPKAPRCGGYSQYHVYEEVSHSKFNPNYTPWVAFDGNNARREPDPQDRQYGSPFIEGWTPLPVLDQRFMTMAEGTEAPFITMAFVHARASLLELAMKSYDTMFDLREAKTQRELIRNHLCSINHLQSCIQVVERARHSDDYDQRAMTAPCNALDEDARLCAKICKLEEESAKTATEAACWWLSVLNLFFNNEGRIEGLSPW